MVNRKGEEFSSFIKADLETGRLSYSRTPDGFEQREQFKIPAELWGRTLTATERAQLQDGKAVLIEGMIGFDKKPFAQYVKANFNTGRLDYYNEDPTRKRDASQRKCGRPGSRTASVTGTRSAEPQAERPKRRLTKNNRNVKDHDNESENIKAFQCRRCGLGRTGIHRHTPRRAGDGRRTRHAPAREKNRCDIPQSCAPRRGCRP